MIRENVTLVNIAREPNIEAAKFNINVRCFGKFKVSYCSPLEELKWRTKKAEEIFAYLVDSMDRDVGKDELMGKIFGEFDVDNAYNYLKTSIHYIKKTVSTAGMDELIINTKGGYKLEAEELNCDYYKFIFLASEPLIIDNNSIIKYEELPGIYVGGYLEGNFYSWAKERAEKIRAAYLNMLINMGSYYKNIGNYMGAINILRKGLKVDLLNMELNKKIIEIYIAQKDRLAAVKHFDTYKRKLKSEFGLEVDEDIKKILR